MTALAEADDPAATIEALSERVRVLSDDLELARESAAEVLALDDRGWRSLTGQVAAEIDREGLRRVCEVTRAMLTSNPLIRRGVQLDIAYVWGQGVSVTASTGDDDEGGQDVNAVVQAFWDDPGNKVSFTSAQAHEERHKALATDGNYFLTLFTNPTTGRVEVRALPFAEVADVICNPEDRAEPWFYKRVWTRTTVTGVRDVMSGRTETRTASETVTEFYPALSFRPRLRPKAIDGHEVIWNAPVLHCAENRQEGWKYGIGDVYTAIFFARGYKEFLQDWAVLVKALSKFAWRATTSARNGPRVRERLAAAQPIAAGRETLGAGGSVVMDQGTTLEAIPKTGATIDSNSGRPLAAMVAAALGKPVTMLLCDPGQEGARAVAQTLDLPTQLGAEMSRDRHAGWIRDVLAYVVEQSVRAPGGLLQGTRLIDPYTGRETVALAGDQDPGISVTFPSLIEQDPVQRVNAVEVAHTAGGLAPELAARLYMEALGVEDVDEWLETMRDASGEIPDPRASAGQAAVDAFNRGEDPAAQF